RPKVDAGRGIRPLIRAASRPTFSRKGRRASSAFLAGLPGLVVGPFGRALEHRVTPDELRIAVFRRLVDPHLAAGLGPGEGDVVAAGAGADQGADVAGRVDLDLAETDGLGALEQALDRVDARLGFR